MRIVAEPNIAQPFEPVTPADPRIHLGAIAPCFRGQTESSPNFSFDTVGGRYVALSFVGSTADPASRRVAEDYRRIDFPFDDCRACAFIVAGDPADIAQGRLATRLPGIRVFRDFAGIVARLYGGGQEVLRTTFILDPMMRILEIVPFGDGGGHLDRITRIIAAQPQIPGIGVANAPMPAPILVVPNVFEPGFCRMLIDLYDRRGGVDSGFMLERDGLTYSQVDHRLKRRSDHTLENPMLISGARKRILRRLVPMVERSFQYRATRMERYLVACYESTVGGFFRPHRDNTTRATAHRRFAVSLHLNPHRYEGGELRFPEFGQQTYRAPVGAAIVFSCNLLHEVTPVTSGRRFMFLPFLYDDAAAEMRVRNRDYLAGADEEA